MSKTFYYPVWSDINLSHLINAIENDKSYTDVVVFAPEEHEPGSLWVSREQYFLVKRFLDYHNVSLKTVVGVPIDKGVNPRYRYSDLPNLIEWPTFFSNFILKYNLEHQIYPYQHNIEINKHFISLNSRAHPWRCMFIDYMYKYGLFEKGYVSWHNIENWNYSYNFKWWKPEIINFDDNWINNESGIKDIFRPPEQFKDSLFSVISESSLDTIFVTEKTYLPIYHKRPFIIFGAPGIHRYLASLGFKLFDEIIDYSFDSVENDERRCNLFMNQVARICKHDIQRLKNKLKLKIDHNFYTLVKNSYNKKFLSKDLLKILKKADSDSMKPYIEVLNIKDHPSFDLFINKTKLTLKE